MYFHLDAPSAPGGPLEATDIKATEITLAWKPPPDDGGAKIEKYILEKKPKGSNRWQKVPGKYTVLCITRLKKKIKYNSTLLCY